MSDQMPAPDENQTHDPQARDVLRPHAYDGIQEYDNPPPGWLMAVFAASILFAMGYAPYYLLGYALDFDTPSIRLAQELKELDAERAALLKAHPELNVGPSEEVLAALTSQTAVVDAGRQQFATTCAACHGPEGQGLIGPNLTDAAWLHGSRLTDIRKSIHDGVPAKGMMAWGPLLKPEALDSLVVYIRTLQGTSPSNPKAPEGTTAAVLVQ